MTIRKRPAKPPFKPSELPLPAAFVRLPFIPESPTASLMPAPVEHPERNPAAPFICRTVLQRNKVRGMPAGLCTFQGPAVEYFSLRFSRNFSLKGDTDPEIVNAACNAFPVDTLLGFSHMHPPFALDTLCAPESDSPVTVAYYRLALDTLPICFRSYRREWRSLLKKLQAHTVVVCFDFRYDPQTPHHLAWDSRLIGLLVHLGAQTESILAEWVEGDAKRNLQIVFLPPRSFTILILESERAQLLKIRKSLGEHTEPPKKGRCPCGGAPSFEDEIDFSYLRDVLIPHTAATHYLPEESSASEISDQETSSTSTRSGPKSDAQPPAHVLTKSVTCSAQIAPAKLAAVRGQFFNIMPSSVPCPEQQQSPRAACGCESPPYPPSPVLQTSSPVVSPVLKPVPPEDRTAYVQDPANFTPPVDPTPETDERTNSEEVQNSDAPSGIPEPHKAPMAKQDSSIPSPTSSPHNRLDYMFPDRGYCAPLGPPQPDRSAWSEPGTFQKDVQSESERFKWGQFGTSADGASALLQAVLEDKETTAENSRRHSPREDQECPVLESHDAAGDVNVCDLQTAEAQHVSG